LRGEIVGATFDPVLRVHFEGPTSIVLWAPGPGRVDLVEKDLRRAVGRLSAALVPSPDGRLRRRTVPLGGARLVLWGDPVWPRAEVVRADGASLVEATTLDALDLRARIEALDLPDVNASSGRTSPRRAVPLPTRALRFTASTGLSDVRIRGRTDARSWCLALTALLRGRAAGRAARVGLPIPGPTGGELRLSLHPDGRLVLERREPHGVLESATLGAEGLLLLATACAQALDFPQTQDERAEVRRLVRWARALGASDRVSAPRPTKVLPFAAWRVATSPAETLAPLPVGRLHHVAFRVRWRRTLERFRLTTFSADGEVALVETRAGTRALDLATGRDRWAWPGAHRPCGGAPSGALVDAFGRLFKVDTRTGVMRWRTRPSTVAERMDLALDAGPVWVFSDDDGRVVALDADTGRRRWSARVLWPAVLGVASGPQALHLTSEDGFWRALDLDDGVERLRVRMPGALPGALRVEGDRVYIGAARGLGSTLVAYEASTGHAVWSCPLAGALLGRPSIVRRRLVLHTQLDDSTVVHVLDVEHGAPLWTRTLAGARAALGVYDGLVTVTAAGGCTTALDLDDGATVWQLPGWGDPERELAPLPPLPARGLLLMPGAGLRIVRPADGHVISTLAIEGFEVSAFLVSQGGDLLLSDGERRLALLEQSGHLAAVP
jgi:outer membrane protein assembly factor BamB